MSGRNAPAIESDYAISYPFSRTAVYDFSPFLKAPAVRQEAAPYGAPQIIDIPDTCIPSPLAPNIAPSTIQDLKGYLTGKGNQNGQKGNERGVEVWEAWKRAWDLWNNHYIEGRECPTWIKSEYERIKKAMEEAKKNKKWKPPGGGDGEGRARGHHGRGDDRRVVYSRRFAEYMPPAQPGRMWIRNPFRTKKIQVPSGQKVLKNNPDPVAGAPKIMKRRTTLRLVGQYEGDTVKVYRREPEFEHFEEERVVRANGPWHDLESWDDAVQTRAMGTDVGELETEDMPESELEPSDTNVEKVRVKRIKKHLDHMDIRKEAQPFPLMSWDKLRQARAMNGIPKPLSDEEAVYINKRPQLWQPSYYKLIDTGLTEVLTDDRRVEVPVKEEHFDYSRGIPFVEVEAMKEIIAPQWAEVDDPNYDGPIPPTTSTGNGPIPSPPPRHPVPPNSGPLDFEIYGQKDHPRYNEWLNTLPNIWNQANPSNLASSSNLDWLSWRASKIAQVQRVWTHLKTPMTGVFQSASHNNGHLALRSFTLAAPQATEQDEEDEDMADVPDSGEEYEDLYEDAEMDMEDCEEQRALGEDEEDEIMSQQAADVVFSDDDDNEAGNAHDNAGRQHAHGGNGGREDAGDGIGPPPRGPDGAAAGFLPMKLFPEYKEPVEDENGNWPEWTDALENTVWRPRRVGEKKTKVDLDEPWGKITDLEVDGGVDCGRSPYPVLRSVNKYVKNETRNGVTYRKEKVWDGVTGTIFNMPTHPDEPEPETLDEREERIKTLYSDLQFGETARHDIFPLDIRRIRKVDHCTGDLFEPKKTTLPPGETEIDFDFPWSNPAKEYPVLDDTDPWWVTPEQEKLRDVPPRRYPPTDVARPGDKYLPLDTSRWKEEVDIDGDHKARYFVTNLHGGTLIINGKEIKKGCIAGPLPDFAVIETPGGQVSFWWGVGGRNWGHGAEHISFAANWRALRRKPGWEHVGLNAGQVWNRIIRDRLLREESGNEEEDDEQWEIWKNAPPSEGQTRGGVGGAGNNNRPVRPVHPPVEICRSSNIGPPCSLNAFKPPEVFESDLVELQWLHTRAALLRDAALGLLNSSGQQGVTKEMLLAQANLPQPEGEDFWPGPQLHQAHPEIQAQELEDQRWQGKRPRVLAGQEAVQRRHKQRKDAERAAKTAAYDAANAGRSKKRKEENEERSEESKRIRLQIKQQIRDTEANAVVARQNHQRVMADRAAREARRPLVLQEATKLWAILKKTNCMVATEKQRRAERAIELQQEADRLAKVNGVRATQGLPPLPPRKQSSQTEWEVILSEALKYVDPNLEKQAKDAAEAERVRKEEEVRKIIADKAAKELADHAAERARKEEEAKKIPPTSEEEIKLENRRLRFLAAQARSEEQKRKDEEEKKKRDDHERFWAAKARSDDAYQRRIDAENRKYEAEQAAKAAAKEVAGGADDGGDDDGGDDAPTPPPPPPTPSNPPSRGGPTDPRGKGGTGRSTKQPNPPNSRTQPNQPTELAPSTNPTTRQVQHPAAVLAAAKADTDRAKLQQATAIAYETLNIMAQTNGLSVRQYLRQRNLKNREEWLLSWQLDLHHSPPPIITKRNAPNSLGPDPGAGPGDREPAKSALRPANLTPDPGVKSIDNTLSLEGQQQLYLARLAMRDAARQGIMAIATAQNEQPYQVAWRKGWVDAQAMIHGFVNSITRDDLQDTIPIDMDDRERLGNERWRRLSEKILEAGEWWAQVDNLQRNVPVPLPNGGAEI